MTPDDLDEFLRRAGPPRRRARHLVAASPHTGANRRSQTLPEARTHLAAMQRAEAVLAATRRAADPAPDDMAGAPSAAPRPARSRSSNNACPGRRPACSRWWRVSMSARSRATWTILPTSSRRRSIPRRATMSGELACDPVRPVGAAEPVPGRHPGRTVRRPGLYPPRSAAGGSRAARRTAPASRQRTPGFRRGVSPSHLAEIRRTVHRRWTRSSRRRPPSAHPGRPHAARNPLRRRASVPAGAADGDA